MVLDPEHIHVYSPPLKSPIFCKFTEPCVILFCFHPKKGGFPSIWRVTRNRGRVLRGVQSHRARIKSSAAFECSSSFIAAVTTAFLMFVFFRFSRKTVPIEDSTDDSVKALAVGDDGQQGGGQSGLGSRMRVTTRAGAPSLPRVPQPISRRSFLSPCFWMEGDTGDKGERGGPGECKKGEPPVSAIVLMVDGEGATKGAGDR